MFCLLFGRRDSLAEYTQAGAQTQRPAAVYKKLQWKSVGRVRPKLFEISLQSSLLSCGSCRFAVCQL
jgi:hypothetical protein